DAVAQFLQRGIRDEAALRLALAHGDTAVVKALRASGATDPGAAASDVRRSATPLSAREAIERSLPLLQHSDVVFLKSAGCVSCHNNSLFEMTTAMVRPRGFRIDDAAAVSQEKIMGAYIESWRERMLQDIAIPGGVDTMSYMLAGLAFARHPSDTATDALARYLMRRQSRDGGWRIITARPPIESSDFAATALSIRGVQAYAPAPQAAVYAQSIQRAAAWLRDAEPHSTEDHVFKVLGLVWARADKRAIRGAAQTLIALQRPDGGWSQIPTLQSDAYATGQALTALVASGLSVNGAVYRQGSAFLRQSQLEDGSWHVRSRAVPIQPYFESGFPHGHDQFVSAAATNWATMALVAGVR
ncbi:MAG TPA: prenyltransferase/squalene oxidase repeat-containing protein, partial [Vicinamibacterales bacterium]|nr:prenyltransferase/squalene oxidase repeat-containing protein [Vicinamibacterales bacterium]